MDAVEIRGIDPRFDGQLTLRGGCAQGRVIGRDDVVVLTVEAQGEIRAGAKLHHAVDREVLRVVLKSFQSPGWMEPMFGPVMCT